MLQLPGGPDDDHVRQRKFDEIAQAMPGFGGKSMEVRFGITNLAFAASTTLTVTGIAHGLGRVPVAIIATSHGAPSFGQLVLCDTGGWTTTTFQLNGELKTAYTGTIPVSWIAIG